MSQVIIPFWKKAPFFRLLLPLVTGILAAWYLQPAILAIQLTAAGCCLVICCIHVASPGIRYRFRFIVAPLVFLLVGTAGAMLVYKKDVRQQPGWIGNFPPDQQLYCLRLLEPPVEKTNSVKCLTEAEWMMKGSGSGEYTTDAERVVIGSGSGNHTTGFDQRIKKITTSAATTNSTRVTIKGGVYLYLEKDSSLLKLPRGTRILLSKKLSPVLPTGNPQAFDYRQYSLFQGITHQVYLRKNEYHLLKATDRGILNGFFPWLQQSVLSTIRKYIPGKKESGLAEALLIGYKQDLDPDLVSAYTNTGLAHVIAISGMHLALIYWLLMLLFRRLEKKKGFRYLAPLCTIAGLWIFTLLAGAQPSVLRAAVMFSCIVAGKALSRNHSIYNSLAASAFLLLCFNPFWLWDLGFLLSYAAVLSLLVFMNRIYRCLFFANKLVDLLWQSVAVSIAAQVLTLPLAIFSFHQFPNYFILSNLIAVPVSTLVLFGEIILCLCSFAVPVATYLGIAISTTLTVLNQVIEHIAKLPFATLDALSITVLQAILLYGLIASVYAWLTGNKKWALHLSLALTLLFMGLRAWSFYAASSQQYLLVYNVPKKTAIDLVEGRHCFFTGDPPSPQEYNFHISPHRIYARITGVGQGQTSSPTEKGESSPVRLTINGSCRILWFRTSPTISPDLLRAGSPVAQPGTSPQGTGYRVADSMGADRQATDRQGADRYGADRLDADRHATDHRDTDRKAANSPTDRPKLDLLILSRQSIGALAAICRAFLVNRVVLDATVPDYAAAATEQECLRMGIPCHAVSMSGSFRFPGG
ncbi:MAG: ComEC family competence protein [Chitinophagaceae bacterium]|nr:MAG: ComEC family competence protein [Chitinophagaceae bacterium]